MVVNECSSLFHPWGEGCTVSKSVKLIRQNNLMFVSLLQDNDHISMYQKGKKLDYCDVQ